MEKIQQENFSTEVIWKDLDNGIKDEYGVIYSIDGKKLLKSTNKDLESYKIKKDCEIICDGAFKEHSSLKVIEIPNSIIRIGWRAVFFSCTELISINVDEDNGYYSSIDGVLFDKKQDYLIHYPAGKKDVIYKIPNGVTKIVAYSFMKCTNLTTIIIPRGVTTIGRGAFMQCTSLTSITIPNSVSKIYHYVFIGCTSLTSINVDEGNKFYSSIDGVLFCNIYKNLNQNELICYPAGKKDVTYNIPDGVTIIGERAFALNTNLINITIPKSVSNSVTGIGYQAFRDCTSLTSITIQEGVKNIGDGAFWGCTGLTDIVIPNSVTEISIDTFKGCTSLTNITIPTYTTVVDLHGDRKYLKISDIEDCTGLTNITIPATTILDLHKGNIKKYSNDVLLSNKKDVLLSNKKQDTIDYYFCYLLIITIYLIFKTCF